MLRTLGWLLAALVLLFTGVAGVHNGTTEWRGAATLAQKSVTIGVLLYGVLGLAAGVGLLMRRRWSYPAAVAWGVAVTYVATVAVVAYGGAAFGAAAAAGAVTAIIAVLVAAAARKAVTVPNDRAS